MKTVVIHARTPYEARIEGGLLRSCGEQIAACVGGHIAAVVSDDAVFPLYGGLVCEQLRQAGYAVCSFVIPHGEASKSFESYVNLISFLNEHRLHRSDVVVALGGGVVGDLAGFAAATYLRGIRLVQVPTTLLSCVDSSVGGKTAVDLPAGKNLVGCFYPPSLVLCDPDCLSTLPASEWQNGSAEVIKYAFLNESFYRTLQNVPIRAQITRVLADCISIKRDFVEADELDTGCRRLLNLGHTVGHAVESLSGFSVPHGQAVAIGMTAVFRAAAARGLCSAELPGQLSALLRQYGLPEEAPFSAAEVAEALTRDKKADHAAVSFIVPEAPGACRVLPVPYAELSAWLKAGGLC